MKMFKRFAAALLAGVMVLAMLTACGGTGNGNDAATAKFEASVEQAYMDKLNDVIGKEFKKEFENDAAIKELAVKHIEEVANQETLSLNNLWMKDETTQNQVMICFDTTNKGYVKLCYEANKAGTITPDEDNIKILKTTLAGVQALAPQAGKKGELTALGVGAKTIDGKTYVAIGFNVQ